MIQNGKYAGVKDTNVTAGPDSNLSIWQQTKVRDSYRACAEKGVDIPNNATLENLPSTIRQIPDSPFMIDSDYVFRKKNKLSVVPAKVIGSRVLYYLYSDYGQYTPLEEADLSTVEEINSYGCYYAFYNSGLKKVKLDNLRHVSDRGLYWAFRNTNITELILDNLESDTGSYAFYGMCYGCTRLERVSFKKLASLTGTNALGSAFQNTALTELSFPELSTVVATAQFTDMLKGVNGCTVHFLKSLESTMSGWTSVLNGFGGTNTTVLFDLGRTITVNAPAQTELIIDDTYIGIVPEGGTTVLLSDGQHTFTAINNTVAPGKGLCQYFTTSSEMKTLDIDFDAYEYYRMDLVTTPVYAIPSVHAYIMPDGLKPLRLEIQKLIDEQTSNGYIYFRLPGDQVGAGIYLDGDDWGDYSFYRPRWYAYNNDDYETLEYLALRSDVTYSSFNGNWEDVITLDGYWSIDSGGYLICHPDISTAYNTSKAINVQIGETPANKIIVDFIGHVSSEANYDFGFASVGTEQVTPTATNIKNGVIANGNYIYRQSGPNNEDEVYSYSDWGEISGPVVISFGYAQDGSGTGGTRTLYVSRIRIRVY